ncbi:MAG TPA: KTSC domain-containing protein [Bryobacteraceae bacterium]|nr:KTSC domain-containing protein [Bryobacteraceae bacterium]
MPLDSSALSSAACVEPEHTLYLRFHSGELYRYFHLPPEQYQDFLAADSHGRYFAYHIRDRFPCEHLARSGRASA